MYHSLRTADLDNNMFEFRNKIAIRTIKVIQKCTSKQKNLWSLS